MEMATINKRTTKATPTAFTLVELLVVITIIGILAALITVAAIGGLKKAQEARIKAEINQIATAVDDYKNKYTAYPPNSQTDGAGPIDENGVLTDFRRHIKQLAPRSQESDDMALVFTGQRPADKKKFIFRCLRAELRQVKRSCFGWVVSVPTRSFQFLATADLVRHHWSECRIMQVGSHRISEVGLSIRCFPARTAGVGWLLR